METTVMTPRHIREELEKIDRALTKLQPWEETLAAARKRYLLSTDEDAPWTLSVIDDGPHGSVRPSDPDFAGFDEGLPGLKDTQKQIALLQERRPLLVHQLPSAAETAESIHAVKKLAQEIRAGAERLATLMATVSAALNQAAPLVLDLADEARKLWENNLSLDKLAADADVLRPETPHLDAPNVPVAAPLALLLMAHFTDPRPASVDPTLRRELLALITPSAIATW